MTLQFNLFENRLLNRFSLLGKALGIALFLSCAIPVFAQIDEKDPVALFNRGQNAHEKGELANALRFYEEALKILPEFPEAEYQRGAALQSLGKDSEAEKAFRRALALRADWNLPLTALGETLARENKFPEASAVLTKAIELDANNLPAYVALTTLLLKTKSPPEILKPLLVKLQTISEKNQTPSIWAARGAIERNLGDQNAAKYSLALALKLESGNNLALSESVELRLAENNFSEAQSLAEKLIKVSPNYAGYKILLARVFAAAGEKNRALELLNSLDGKNSDVLALKNSLITAGATDIADLEKQLAEQPQSAAVLGRLCVVARPMPAKALDYCRRASELEPTNTAHAVGFGAALVQAQKFPEAISLLRRLLPLEPENYAIRANLALALFKSNNFAEAKTEYQWLIAKNPNLSAAYYFLAICCDNLQEYEEAFTNYRKFLEVANIRQNQLEIDKVNLRLPSLERQIKQGRGKKKKV